MLLQKLYGSTLAATPETIKQIEEVLLRHETTKLTVEDLKALETRIGKPLANNPNLYMRGKTAVIPVIGSITRRGTMFSEVSGMTSTEKIGKDYIAALENPEVESIVLDIDSGGGEANSVSELASAIREGSAKKPTYAYSGGSAQSAAYWIGSAVPVGNFIGGDTAQFGSIGVALFIDVDQNPSVKELVFKSSKTPDKLPDPLTKHGSKLIQDKLDATYSVFRDKVMLFRDNKVDPDELAGRTLIGADAVKAGLIDRLGSFEGLIKELNPKENDMKEENTATAVETKGEVSANETAGTVSTEQFKALEAKLELFTKNEEAMSAKVREYEAKLAEAEKFEAEANEKLLGAAAETAAISLGSKLTPTQKPLFIDLYKFISATDNTKLDALTGIVGTQTDISVLTDEQMADEELIVLKDELPVDESKELKEETAKFIEQENKRLRK